jgi:FkbM family methyltransferase
MTVRADLTIVADVGARYGIHPSFRRYDAPMRYLAFEPDADEAARLRGAGRGGPHMNYEVFEVALDRQSGVRDFYLLRHRGLSSFLKPDLNSECFRHLKPGQAEIDRVIPIETERLDAVFERLDLIPDFIKIDTEGTEQDVLEGGAALLSKGVLGIRLSCNFQPCFIGQRLFSESHEYLLKQGYILLNLDYKGYGYPRLGLFRKPDPMENEDFRYGILVAADAVWIRHPNALPDVFQGSALAIAILKLAYFCLLNNAPDLAVDLLREAAAAGRLTAEVKGLRLARTLQIQVAQFLGRWRTVPDEQWEKARGLYGQIYGEPLGGGSDFYPQMDRMRAELQVTK